MSRSVKFKLVIIGGQGSGKTSIIKRALKKQVKAREKSTNRVESQDLSV